MKFNFKNVFISKIVVIIIVYYQFDILIIINNERHINLSRNYLCNKVNLVLFIDC